jgi:hypothetical protein
VLIKLILLIPVALDLDFLTTLHKFKYTKKIITFRQIEKDAHFNRGVVLVTHIDNN